MDTTIVQLQVGSGPDDLVHTELLRFVSKNKPEGTVVSVDSPTLANDKENHDVIEEYLSEYVQAKLETEDYLILGREVGDIKNITFAELYRVGKPIPRGGGGLLTQIAIDLLNSDAPVMIAAITALASIIKQAVEIYFSRYDNRSLTLKHGGNEITVTGYSKEDAEKMVDEFFAEIRRKQLMEQGNRI